MPDGDRGHLVKNQAALAGTLYLLLLPIGVVFLARTGWPEHLVWWFVPILILEHINQELSRLLIVLSQQITASVILFVRQGSWAIAAVALMGWNASNRNLDTAMMLWSCAGVAAAGLGLWKLRRLRLGGWRKRVDWSWIRKGVRISGAFLVATLALRSIQTVDRYWLQDLAGIEVVGAYVLFIGISGALMVFLDAGVFSFIYPELLRHAHNNEYEIFHRKIWRMLIMVLFLSIGFAVSSSIVLPYLLNWIGKPIYVREMSLYYWILTAMVINAIGWVPHYALYAGGHDRPIILGHIAALPAFVLTVWALGHIYAAEAVPIGLCIAYAVVLLSKTFAYWRVVRTDNRQKLSAQF